MENFKKTANVLADKALLDVLASDPDTPFSKVAFQTVLDVFDKVSLPSNLDHGNLQKVYDCLRKWSSFEDVSSVLPRLARVYDNLIHRDLGQPNLSNAVCELLFLIEDMADHRQCKILAGEHFLQRLLALAGSKLTGIKLQRTAVETLSSIIIMCPPNQKLLLEDLIADWLYIVRRVLPLCGDFFVQASIVEVLYRLSKRSPELLDCLEDKTLREKMVLLHQKKKPDLLVETRYFLEHMNHSLGKSQSVYSFLAEDIIFDGRSTPLMDERWVHFGMDHLSCYTALDSDSEQNLGNATNSVSLLDVFYNRICDVHVCSNHSIDFAFRESLSPAQNTWIRLKTIKLKLFLKSEDLEILMDSVLSRINHCQKELQKGVLKPGDCENTNTTPSFSAKIERSFRKASVGFAIPLPRKFRLPSLSKISYDKIAANSKVSGNLITHPKEVLTQDATCKNGCIDKYVLDPNAGKSSTELADATINKESNHCLSAHQPEEHTEAGPKQTCSQYTDNCKILPSFSHPKDDCTIGAKKISGRTSLQSRKDAVSSCRTSACLNTIDSGHKGDPPNRPKIRTDSESAKESGSNEAEPGSELEFVEKGSCHDNAGAVENGIQHSSLSKGGRSVTNKALTPKDVKSADTKQATHLQEKILNILNNANLPVSDADDVRKQKNSTSDPIETDSEQNRSVAKNIRAKVISRSTLKQKPHAPCQGQELFRVKRQNRLLLEKAEKCLSKASEKDVFSFDENEHPVSEDNPCLAGIDKRIKLTKVKADNCLPKSQPFLADDQQWIAANDTNGKLTESKSDNGLVKRPSFPAHDQHCTAAKEKLSEAGTSKSEDNNDIADFIQPDTPAVSPNLCDAKVTGSEEAFLFKSVHRVRQRKRDLNTDKSPAKKSKKSPELTVALDNSGHVMSREVSSYEEASLVGEKSNNKLDKELLMCYSSPKQTEKEANMSWKSPCFTAEERRFPFRPIPVSSAKEGPNCGTGRRARRRNQRPSGIIEKPVDVEMSLIDEHLQTTETVPLEAVPNGEMQLVAALVHKMMKKIKVNTEKKSTEILACAMEAVQQRCQEVQEQIQADLDECTKTSGETFQQLQLQLEEQHETFQGIQKKWRNEFENGLNRFQEISSQVDSSQSYLKSISDTQKIAHRRLFSSMGEFVELHLNETEQKLLALQKAAKGIRNELRVALLQIF
ncbi:hypothetical protein GOP47_0026725 [Adiantum capillus-veneris]|nr:hypothetical protein GOP47_0026725 [Adiantum capillus-veneris]